MGIFQAKPSMVEAEQFSEKYNEENMRKLMKWFQEDSKYVCILYFNKRLELYLEDDHLVVDHGDWIVKLGDGRYEIYSPDEFNARYSWIGPKEHYDAPYMVN